MDWLLIWTAITAAATILGAFAAVAAAVAAVVTLKALREDSNDRSRPVVIAELHPNPILDHVLDLRIRNVGATPAKDLRVAFDPDPLIDPADTRELKHTGSLLKRYAKAIPLLPAGSKLSNIYWRVDPQNDTNNVYPLPDQVNVTVTYSDLRSHHTYTDTFNLDAASHGHETYTRPGGVKFDKRTAEAVEAIARGVGSA